MTDRVQLVDLENRALEDIFTNIQTRYLLRLQENEEVEQAPHIHYNIYKRILNCFLEMFARRIDALDNYHSDSRVTWEDSECYNEIFEFINDWEDRDLINTLKLELLQESKYYKYWSDMLNLNNTNICQLLPYLLTAYIANIHKNSFFQRGSSSIDEVFNLSSDDFDPANKHRRIKQIERLSAKFSLKEFKNPCNSKKSKRSNASSDRPSPHYLDRRFPYREADFLHYVFYIWASVIMEESLDEEDITKEDVNVKNILGTIRATISLVDSYMLVLKYTNNSELDKFQELLDRKGGLITNSDMLTYLENKFAIMPFA